MTTNAQFAAKLLRDAAMFFRSVGEQNPDLADEMEQNADSYEVVASWVESDPTAETPVPVPGEDGDGSAAAGT